MTLPDFINEVGAMNLAYQLRVTPQQIYQWRGLQAVPKVETAYKLILMSKGRLSFESIYLDHCKRIVKGLEFVIPNNEQLTFKI